MSAYVERQFLKCGFHVKVGVFFSGFVEFLKYGVGAVHVGLVVLVVVKGDSARMVRQFGMHYYSFAYVDGSHQAPDLLIDLVNVFLVLKRGGVCIVDDYLWHPGLGVLHEPRLAIDAFLIVFDELIEVLDIGYQVAIRKR